MSELHTISERPFTIEERERHREKFERDKAEAYARMRQHAEDKRRERFTG